VAFTNTVTKPDSEHLVVVSYYHPPLDFAAAIAGKQFTRLHVYGRPTNFHLLPTLTQLVELRMQGTRLTDLSALAGMKKLEELVYTSGSLKELDLSFAGRTLTSLWLSSHRSLTDLTSIGACRKLKSLTLRGLANVSGFVDLAALRRLEFLALWNVRRWPTLTGLARATNLRKLLLDQTEIEDGRWEPLLRLKRLEFVSGLQDAFGKTAAARFREKRPDVQTPRRFPA